MKFASVPSSLVMFSSTRTEFGEIIMGTEGTIEITVGTDDEPAITPDDLSRRAFYPLTMPLTVGPGQIAAPVDRSMIDARRRRTVSTTTSDSLASSSRPVIRCV